MNALLFCTRIYIRIFACLCKQTFVALILRLKSFFGLLTILILSGIQVLNLDTLFGVFLQCFYFSFGFSFCLLIHQRAFNWFLCGSFADAFLFFRRFSCYFIDFWSLLWFLIVTVNFAVNFWIFGILFILFRAIGSSYRRDCQALFVLHELNFDKYLLDRFFNRICNGYLFLELWSLRRSLIVFGVKKVICLRDYKLVIEMILRVFGEIIKGMILNWAELVKVFIFVVLILNATDKFSNPTGGTIALIRF